MLKVNNAKYLIVLFYLLFLNGCSSSLSNIKTIALNEESIYDNDLRINIKQIYCWINRMPGAKPRFNITGELNIFESSKFNFKNVTIKKIYIIQEGKEVYQFTPKIETDFIENKKSIIFSTIKGMLLSLQLNTSKNIDIKILLTDSNSKIDYFINNIAIEEVY